MFISAEDSLLKGTPPLVEGLSQHSSNVPIKRDIHKMYKWLQKKNINLPKGLTNQKVIELYTKHFKQPASRMYSVPMADQSVVKKQPKVEKQPVVQSPSEVSEFTPATKLKHTARASMRKSQEKPMFISAKDSLVKGVLTTEDREDLKQKQFALPKKAEDKEEKAESGNYPIPDLSHARNALAMVARYGNSSEQAKVRAAVYKKYPQLDKRKEDVKKSCWGR